MRIRWSLWSVAVVVGLALAAGELAAQTSTLSSLFQRRDCFGLRDALRNERGGAPELELYRAASAAAFNQPDRAVEHATRFVRGEPRDTALLALAYGVLGDAHSKAYRYREAARSYAAAVAMQRDSAERAEAANFARLWSAVAKVPAQTIAIPAQTRLATTRDGAGLLNVEVEAGGRRFPFMWDTGAGLSMVPASTAAAMGLRVSSDSVVVGASTGARRSARVAHAPELRMGGVTVRNAIFLVFPDDDLSFPRIDYRIQGIIGFPVIAGLGRTTLTRDGGLVIGGEEARDTAESNLCLDGLTPLVAVTYRGRRLHFALDTGASRTFLFLAYFEAYREQVMARGKAGVARTGGIGGMRDIAGFTLPAWTAEIGRRNVSLIGVGVWSEKTVENSGWVYGNVGQDVIRQFGSMTLDFRTMRFRLD
ncbi:MAG TPA: retropepsin-like aspartic protease [Longimicrobium sp.]|nr:retropepsin-like aspartic protease [Longimicrobium sp.]